MIRLNRFFRMKTLLNKSFEAEGHPSDALPGSFEYCVSYGRRDRRCADFAHTSRIIRAGHDISLNHRHFVNSQGLVLVEIGLLNSSLLERNVAAQCGAQSVNDGALHLLFNARRVDGDAAIHGTDDAMDADFALYD